MKTNRHGRSGRWCRAGGVLLAMVLGCDGAGDGTSSEGTDDTGADDSLEIYALQQGELPSGEPVTIRDVVVTGTGLVGFWVQEPEGGPYSGLWIDAGFDWTDVYAGVEPGARVDVSGTFLEYDMEGAWPDTVSEIVPDADGVAVQGMAPEPEPVTIDYAQLVDPTLAEPWESVVVGFEHPVQVDSTDTGFGGWSVSDGQATLDLQNSMYRPEPLELGDGFDAMAGVLQHSFGTFKLEPRRDDDLVPTASG